MLRIRRDILEGQKSIALFKAKMIENGNFATQPTYIKPHQEDKQYF